MVHIGRDVIYILGHLVTPFVLVHVIGRKLFGVYVSICQLELACLSWEVINRVTVSYMKNSAWHHLPTWLVGWVIRLAAAVLVVVDAAHVREGAPDIPHRSHHRL